MTNEYAERKKQGEEYQDFVTDLLIAQGIIIIPYTSKKYQYTVGENKAGIEIKNDERFKETGNLYIELAEKTNAGNTEYIPSGILRKDNTWIYCIGDYETVYLLSKQQLQIMYMNLDKYKSKGVRLAETPTSRGMLVPLTVANEFMILKKIEIKNDQ